MITNESMIEFENGQKKLETPRKRQPVFQVLIPAFNAMSTIRTALNSVVSQTFKDWVCVVLDDCSEDGTYGILQEYVSRFPNKFRVGRLEKRIPTGEVRNMLMAEGAKFNTPYTLWLDPNDTFGNNEIFQRIYNRLKQTAFPDLLQLSYEIAFEDGTSEFRRAASTSVQQLSENGSWQACWTKCVKSKLLARFDPDLFRFEDTQFHFETLEKVRTVNFYDEGDQFPVVRYKINRGDQSITPEVLTKIQNLSKTLKLDCVKKALQKTIEYWKKLCQKNDDTNEQKVINDQRGAPVGWMSQSTVNNERGNSNNEEKSPANIEHAELNEKYKFGKVTVAMATFPSRIKCAVEVLKSLWPQCNHLKVCLNEFESEPKEILEFRKFIASTESNDHTFEAILANDKNGIPDLGCNNKMRWIDSCDGYYLTVDDDIGYPRDYVEKLVEGINKYDGKAICSFHGKIYKKTPWGIDSENPLIFPFHDNLEQAISVDVCGMGVGGCVPSKLSLKWSVFNTSKNSGDDELLTAFCLANKIQRFVLPKKFRWLIRTPINGYALVADNDSRKKRGRFLEKVFRIKPQISIIIPCHNCSSTIGRLLGKLQIQRNCHWECICVDDSKDTLTEKAIRRRSDIDKRIIYIKNEDDPGAGKNRNIGLAAATGDFVWFVDSDDEFSFGRDGLSNIMAVISTIDSDIHVFPTKMKTDGQIVRSSLDLTTDDEKLYNGQLISGEFARSLDGRTLLHAFKIVPWNKITKRSFLKKHSNILYYQNTHFANDNYFNLQLLRHMDSVAFHNYPPVYLYNHEDNIKAKTISGAKNRSEHIEDMATLFGWLVELDTSKPMDKWIFENRLKMFQDVINQVGKFRKSNMNQSEDAYLNYLASKIGSILLGEKFKPFIGKYKTLNSIALLASREK